MEPAGEKLEVREAWLARMRGLDLRRNLPRRHWIPGGMDPKVAVVAFLIAAGGMLLTAFLTRGSAAKAVSANAVRTECTLGGCPLLIGPADVGRTFNYTPGTRFTFLNDGAKPPVLLCDPAQAVMPLAFSGNVSAPDAPLPALRFEARRTGACSLQGKNFSVTVNVAQFK